MPQQKQFQFQYGAIKSAALSNKLLQFAKFQFQYGAIKSKHLGMESMSLQDISIPIWCD